jgi:hypothetical protein
MRRAGVATLMLLMGSVSCGRTDLDELVAPPQDASSLDAARDSSVRYREAAVTDSYAGADQATMSDSTVADSNAAADEGTPGDSAPDAAPSMDAAEGGDAGDAWADASADASASDAAPQHLPCDQCSRGDQECASLPDVCTYDDAGVEVSCAMGIWTCVAGDAGCAVWAQPVACRSDVPCCVLCAHEFTCPLGPIGALCEQDTDCAMNACDALTHQCITNSCADNRQDGTETDVDCGGFICGLCRVGQGCQSNYDCVGGAYCSPSHVCE